MRTSNAIRLAAPLVTLGVLGTACGGTNKAPVAAHHLGTPVRSASVRTPAPAPTTAAPRRGGIDPARLPLGSPAPQLAYQIGDVVITPTGRVHLRQPATLIGAYDGAVFAVTDSGPGGPVLGGHQPVRVRTDGTMTPIGKPYPVYAGGTVLAPAAGRIYGSGCVNRPGPCFLTQVDPRTGAERQLKTNQSVLYADANGALIGSDDGMARWGLDGRVTQAVRIKGRYSRFPAIVYVNQAIDVLVTDQAAGPPLSAVAYDYLVFGRLSDPNRYFWRLNQNPSSPSADSVGPATPDGTGVFIHTAEGLRLVNPLTGAVEHTFTIASGYYNRAPQYEDGNHFLMVVGTRPADQTNSMTSTEWLVRCTTAGRCVRLTGPITGQQYQAINLPAVL